MGSVIHRLRAFSVHGLTASGAALALLALVLAAERRFTAMFIVLGLALIVDGIDGPLARRWQVAKALPRWSGEALDFVVDYTTYVFVPAFAIAMSGLMPRPLALAGGFIVAVTGALYFADREMKTGDNHFKGFPAVWNVVAFYLLALKPQPWIAAAAIVVLAVLTFVPLRFVHPLRVTKWRGLTIAMLASWIALALATVVADLEPGPWIAAGLLATAVYFLAAGLITARSE